MSLLTVDTYTSDPTMLGRYDVGEEALSAKRGWVQNGQPLRGHHLTQKKHRAHFDVCSVPVRAYLRWAESEKNLQSGTVVTSIATA